MNPDEFPSGGTTLLADVLHMFGIKSMDAARNAIAAGRLPVPAFKLTGKGPLYIHNDDLLALVKKRRDAAKKALNHLESTQ